MASFLPRYEKLSEVKMCYLQYKLAMVRTWVKFLRSYEPPPETRENGPFFKKPGSAARSRIHKTLRPFLIGRRSPFIPVRSLSYLGHCSSFVLSFLFFGGGVEPGLASTMRQCRCEPKRQPWPERWGGNRAEWTAQWFWGSAHNGPQRSPRQASALMRPRV